MEHQAGADDAARDGAEVADQHRLEAALTDVGAHAHHKGGDDHAHAEGGADVGQRRGLVLLEVTQKVLVIRQSQNGGIVGQVGRQHADDGGAGQTVQGLHQRGEDLVDSGDHAELGEQGGQRPGQNRDGHDVQHGVDQQGIGGVHQGVEHIHSAHPAADGTETEREHAQKNKRFQAQRFFGGDRCPRMSCSSFLHHMQTFLASSG